VADAIPLTLVASASGLDIVRADGAPVLSQYAADGERPYIHPIHAPGGAGVLTENAPSHHPWQHGLYVGLNDVNGVGFWSEGLHPKRPTGDGTFSSRIVGAPEATDAGASWEVATDYLDESGEIMLDDTQRWALTASDDLLELDMDWTLHARRDLVFGEYEYGGLFLRMPYRDETGGSAIDSEGQSGTGERARWVAVTMPLPDTGRTAVAALLDHPGNPDSPVPWRIDNELGIGPSPSASGAWALPEDDRRHYRYRLVVFGSTADAAAVEQAWHRFAEEA
jgi:hypothetical protein